MKTWLTIFTFFFLSLNMLYSQSPDFIKLLDENMNYVVDMIPASDGNFIISGTTQNQSNVFVTSVNEDGEIIWSKYFYGEMLWHSRIMQKSNGNILIPMGNFNPLLIELNNLGDSVSSVSISESKKSFFGSVVELQDSTIFVSEIIYNNDPFIPYVDSSYLVKLSLSGNIIDKYLIKNKEIMDIIPVSDNKLFVLVRADSSVNSYIAKYNVNGEILSTSSCSTLNPYLHRLFELNESAYFALGYLINGAEMNAVLSKFDIDCQIEYCTVYNNNYFSSITNEMNTENLYILGENNGFCIINTANSSGNIISEFQLSDSLTGNKIIHLDDYLYITGVNNYFIDPRACFIKIHKDSILLVNEKQVFLQLKVYPNPASDYVIFEHQAKNQQHISNSKQNVIQIMNVFGKLIDELPVKSGKTVWDTRKIKPGVYYYILKTNDSVKPGKLVISK